VEPSEQAHPYLERNIAKYEVDVRVVKERAEVALYGVKSDVVVANPPYIPDHFAISGELPRELSEEPSMALFGGASGTQLPKLFIDAAARILKSGGELLMEHEESQRDELIEYLSQEFVQVGCGDDLNGKHRYIFATRI
jgi:release factor glutamine methyltransferase